ncbi:MAG TPA: M20/M25/M40 family metallo-hydrolase [Bacillota bacterium]|nr:M20/M25/M40 family metallo-hydrolase [Bacillota bacterium]
MDSSRLLYLLKTLVACPSTTDTSEEVGMHKKIHELLAGMEYFRANPENLMLHPIPGDRHGRAAIAALVEGKGKRTVILSGHYDVMDTIDYGPYREYALDTDALAGALHPSTLPADAAADLRSGGWIFGRGTADMKGGLALFMAYLEQLSMKPDKLCGSLLFLAVPDEETNSAGMTGSVEFLNRLSRERGLEYICLVNSEPCTFNHDGTYNIYTGSVGKMLPLVYCFGREAHAREPFKGINANLIMSEIIREIEGNPLLSDRFEDIYTMPPVILKAKDLRDGYSISTPPASACCFNMLSYRRSPGDLILLLKQTAARGFKRALSTVNLRIEEYNSRSGCSIEKLEWEPKVYTYDELYSMCHERHGSVLEKHMKEFAAGPAVRDADWREATIRIINNLHSFCPDRDPKVIIAFAPPYYPHVTVDGKSSKGAAALRALDSLLEYSAEELGIPLKVNRFFDGISDLSYCSIQDAGDVIGEFKPNMPLWGHSYSIPVEEIKRLDVPGIILGPWGRDLHKYTERLNKGFFLDAAPKLLEYFVHSLLGVDAD